MALETPVRTISLQMGAFGGPIAGAQSFHPIDSDGNLAGEARILFMVPNGFLGDPERITVTITAAGE